MAILDEIKKKVKPGDNVYYMDKNNEFDKSTIYDPDNKLEVFVNSTKNWQPILEAIYDENKSSYVVAPLKNSKTDFTVIDTKNTKIPAFIVKMFIKDNALIIENMENKNKTTKIEMSEVMNSVKDTPTAEKQVQRLQKNLKDYINKSPKELKTYLERIVTTL